MWAKLLFYLEAFLLFFLQFIERWLIALTGISGIAGGAIACILFVVSAGYFFLKLRQRSKLLFLSGGFVSLLGGTLLFNEIGQWIGLTPNWSQESSATGFGTTDAVSSETLLGVPSTGDLGSTDSSTSLPDTSIPTASTPSLPVYLVLAASDGTWPALWSDVSSSAYTLTTIPAGAEVQLTSDCVTDVSSNYWCPIAYEGQYGWIASASLMAK